MEIKIVGKSTRNRFSMKKLYAALLVVSLTYPQSAYSVNAEDCEKDGEMVFTRECINRMLNLQKDEQNPNEINGGAIKSQNTSTSAINKMQKNCDTRLFFKALESKEQTFLSQCELTAELINSKDSRAERDGRTPLHWAVLTGNYHLLKRLLDEGAKTNTSSRTDLDGTPLHLAIMIEDKRSSRELLKTEINIDARNIFEETPLHLAIKKQNKDLIQILIENGADIEARDRTGKTPLLTASLFPDVSVISYLLDKGADIDVQTKQGNNPLHYSGLISPTTTEKLLLAGVNISQENASGYTPLEKLRMNFLPQHKSTIQLLASYEKNINDKAIAPLLVSLESDDLETFKTLLKEGTSASQLTIGDLNNKPRFKEALQQAGWL